ncbi:MAG TPA: asparagine synthase-related protein [Gemmatimonadaceae bacterium]|nr:asparagine synthase-related protein [Gemmatimonadaceae bacterium]
MANFIAIVDPDPDRRAAFVRATEGTLALVPGLREGRVALGDCVVAWAAGTRAPIDVQADATTLTVLWGDALGTAPVGRVSAAAVADAWSTREREIPTAHDGFHAALHFDVRRGITMGGDVFGIFPLYYAVRGDTLLAGSSPELFRRHPLCPALVDDEGLVGLLLAYAPFRGRTMLRGVRRLPPRHALRWQAGTASEVLQYEIVGREGVAPATVRDQAEWLHQQYAAAVARHAPPALPVGMLLSGGRDSRLLCGHLGERATGMPALTLGRPGDYEARCARAVARTLRMSLTLYELPAAELPANAARQARWEQMGSSFGTTHTWSVVTPLGALPPRVLTGYLRESLDFRLPDPGFDAVFSSHFNRGFHADALRRLLRPPLRDLVDEAWLGLRAEYLASSHRADERPWRFQLSHYARTHPGSVPWRLAFGSWPVLPILDRALLDAIASVPLDTVAARRAQDLMLRERFPQLARLPLDRNSFDTEPLLPGRVRHRLNPAIVAARRLASRVGLTAGERERRYYYRAYDVNGDGWRRVRAAAEPSRDAIAPLFDMDEVRRWVPSPATRLAQTDAIHDGVRTKTLLGLMLWAADHLS